MKKFITNKYTLFTLGLLFFIGVWWLISILIDKNAIILPSPLLTIEETFHLLGERYTYECLGKSLLRMFIGFSLAFVIAGVFALIVNANERRYQFLSPTMTILKSVPTVAVVFLFIVISGAENAPIFVVILISMPILYESMVSGFKSTDKNVVEAAKVDGASNLGTLFKIRLPMALPYIILGMVSSFSLSFKVEIMSEVVTGYTRYGLGSLIKGTQVNDPTNMTTIFGYSLIAVLTMLIISLAIDLVKKYLLKTEKIVSK